MKRIGIIGGMSYESTLHYYEQINRKVNERAGGLTSADLVLRSVNFEEYHELMEKGDWRLIGHWLGLEASSLVARDGCYYVAIATNTMHKVVDTIAFKEASVRGFYVYKRTLCMGDEESRFVHIGDCIAEKCLEIGAKRVLLLGTKFTMTEDFMKERLARYGVEVMDVSDYPDEVDEIDRIIFEELCHGVVTLESKEFLMNFVWQFPADEQEARPDAIILGCTELDMILEPGDVDVPLIDSTEAHIDKLVELCLS